MSDAPQAAPPRFFVDGLLAETSAASDTGPRLLGSPTPRFAPGEAEHARKALRLRAGDLVEGLDGQGGRWPLRITRLERREAALQLEGEPTFDPAPGEPGAPLPWIEVAVAWPRQTRGTEMLGRLVQLGIAAVRPLEARHQGPQGSPWGPRAGSEPPERWSRLAREACKQSGRTWLPELLDPCSPQALVDRLEGRNGSGERDDPARGPVEVLGTGEALGPGEDQEEGTEVASPAGGEPSTAPSPSTVAAARLTGEPEASAVLAVLDPHRGMAFDTWARSLLPLVQGSGPRRGTRAAPIVLVIGPEGGFAAAETDALLLAGATAVRLTPHVLRIETAAEAAAAVCATILNRL